MVDALLTLLDKLIAAILYIFDGGILTLVVGIVFFVLMLGKVLLYVGIIFGPFFLALAPLRLTTEMTLNWARFTLTAMMYSSVAAVVLLLSGGIFDELARLATDSANLKIPSTWAAIMTGGIAILAGFIMWRVPAITAELFGGMSLHAHAPKVLSKGEKPPQSPPPPPGGGGSSTPPTPTPKP